MNTLEIEQLCVEVDGRPLLHDIHLQIAPGETHVLFGPNGSGKTSLLMAIMGLPRYRISHGRMRFQGEDITSLAADERARRGIGMVYQRPPPCAASACGSCPRSAPGTRMVA